MRARIAPAVARGYSTLRSVAAPGQLATANGPASQPDGGSKSASAARASILARSRTPAPKPTEVVFLGKTDVAAAVPRSELAARALAPQAGPESNLAALVNPPACSRPPKLALPASQPGETRIRQMMGKGKAYFSFYKQAVKNIFSMLEQGRAIRAHPPSTPLSRAHAELLIRCSESRRRLPIFAVFFLLAGEWLPLVVPFITPLVPGPCLLPTQIEAKQSRSATVRAVIARRWPFPQPGPAELVRSRAAATISGAPPPSPTIHQSALLLVFLGRMSRNWARTLLPSRDSFRAAKGRVPIPPILPLTALFFPRARLQAAERAVAKDDAAFLRAARVAQSTVSSAELVEGDLEETAIRLTVHALERHELVAACLARGLTGKGVLASDEEMRVLLGDWLVQMQKALQS